MKHCILKTHCLTWNETKGKETRKEPGKQCCEDPLHVSGPKRRSRALGRDAPKLAIRSSLEIQTYLSQRTGFHLLLLCCQGQNGSFRLCLLSSHSVQTETKQALCGKPTLCVRILIGPKPIRTSSLVQCSTGTLLKFIILLQ